MSAVTRVRYVALQSALALTGACRELRDSESRITDSLLGSLRSFTLIPDLSDVNRELRASSRLAKLFFGQADGRIWKTSSQI